MVWGYMLRALNFRVEKMANGNNNPHDDITRTPTQARQGDKGRRVKWILGASLVLAVVAWVIIARMFPAASPF